MKALARLFGEIDDAKLLDASIPYGRYSEIDLSSHNPAVIAIDGDDPKAFEAYIRRFLVGRKADIAYGGYLEERSLYRRSAIFHAGEKHRNIHLGLDLWSTEGMIVTAPLYGTIHSFKNNEAHGDYGPTIILEHLIADQHFYTLYGHLSVESISGLKKGSRVSKGEPIGTLGCAAVNGDYAPHLHFQIIRDLEGNKGDYPGVCSRADLRHYMANCPDPNLLLKINRQ